MIVEKIGKELIIIGTLKAIVTDGLPGLRIKRIAHSAHVSEGLIFHYFKNKTVLIQKSLTYLIKNRLEKMLEHISFNEDPVETIKTMLNTFESEYNRVPETKVFKQIPQLLNDDKYIDGDGKKYLNELIDLIAIIIKKGQLKKEIIPLSPKFLASTILFLPDIMNYDQTQLLQLISTKKPPVIKKESLDMLKFKLKEEFTTIMKQYMKPTGYEINMEELLAEPLINRDGKNVEDLIKHYKPMFENTSAV